MYLSIWEVKTFVTVWWGQVFQTIRSSWLVTTTVSHWQLHFDEISRSHFLFNFLFCYLLQTLSGPQLPVREYEEECKWAVDYTTHSVSLTTTIHDYIVEVLYRQFLNLIIAFLLLFWTHFLILLKEMSHKHEHSNYSRADVHVCIISSSSLSDLQMEHVYSRCAVSYSHGHIEAFT